MKKLFCLAMVLTMLICMTACSSGDPTVQGEAQPEEISTTDAITTTTTTTTTTITTTTTAPKAKTWEKRYYVDEFDEPTDEWYIYCSFSGTFSNSATNDSRLSGNILIDSTDISIMLYEYNRNQVKNVYSRDKSYTIVVRSAGGDKATFKGTIYSKGDRIFINSSQEASMKNWLKKSGTLKFYIYETDNSVTNYLFEVESDNLSDFI